MGEQLYYGGILPEVVITPDPRLRQRVLQTWPDELVRKQALKEIEQYKRFAENRANGDIYVGAGLGSKDMSMMIGARTYNNDRPANFEVERAMEIVNAAGNPNVQTFYNGNGGGPEWRSNFHAMQDSSGNYIPYVRPKELTAIDRVLMPVLLPNKYKTFKNAKQSGLHINLGDTRSPYLDELSHAYQYFNGFNKMGTWGKRDDFGKASHENYTNPDDMEFQAHSVIEPLIFEYLRNPTQTLEGLNRNIADRIITYKHDKEKLSRDLYNSSHSYHPIRPLEIYRK